MPALLFGSISTLIDTSELQREAFNRAFAEHGLDWTWDRDDYQTMLDSAGGQNRIAAYAQECGEDVDAAAVHRTKSEIFQQLLAESAPQARPGVVDTIRQAQDNGYRTGFVTTTSRGNVDAVLQALTSTSGAPDFDVVTDVTTVDAPKPDGAVYAAALSELGENAEDCIAIEDNVAGVEAAQAAGLTAVAFPNENTAGHDFGSARVVDHVDFGDLTATARL